MRVDDGFRFATQLKRHLVVLIVCGCTPLALHAAPVYDTPADWTGTRTVAPPATAGITTNDADWFDGVLEWSIVDNFDGTLTYTYEFSNFNKPGISHFTLDVSDNAINDPGLVTNALLNGATAPPLEFGDKDGITGAVKFDLGADGTVVYSFTSNRLPVYGHFRLKAGSSSFANNTGFDDETSENILDFIARPDTVVITTQEMPTADAPSTFLLMGMGITSLAAFRRRRRCAAETTDS